MASQSVKFGPLPPDVAQDPLNRKSEVRLKDEALEADFEMVRGRVNDTLALRLVHGYRLGVESLEHFGLDDSSSPIPSLDGVLERYTDEDLKLLEDYQKPSVVIRPPRKDCRDLIGALAHHYGQGVQNGPMVVDRNSIDWGRDTEFRPFILEAVCNVQPKQDILAQQLGGRVARKRELIRSGEYAMTSELYLLLVMQSIVRGQMIDQKTFTVLDGDPIVADLYVPTGQCFNKQPSIEWLPIGCEASRGRFRRVLRGSRG